MDVGKITGAVDLSLVEKMHKVDLKEPVEPEPNMTDEKWPSFVLSKLFPHELDNGNPKVDGLRRVTRLLLGDIVQNTARCVLPPTVQNNFGATCEHTVIIHWKRELPEGQYPENRVFTEVADCNERNTADMKYLAHASATASSKAEGRALRKALMLNNIITAEEAYAPPEVPSKNAVPDFPSPKDYISQERIKFIETVCRKTNINIIKFINSGSGKYRKIEEIPVKTSEKMEEVLSEYQRCPDTIPQTIKGFVENWRE